MSALSKSVLVTGVAGFIGRYVARHFSKLGWTVIGIDNSPPSNASIADLSAYQRLVLPDPAFNSLLRGHRPEICIHCAGPASVGLSIANPTGDFYANTVLTFEILNALRLNAPSCRFIFLSSAAVYGNPKSLPVSEDQTSAPISPYGFHKSQCEQLCVEFHEVYDLPTASLRIFSAYGSGLRRQVLYDICQKAVIQKSVSLQGTGRESRDFIHAIDIARAIMVVATTAPMHGEMYNVASGREVTIGELAGMLLDFLEYDGDVDFDGLVPLGTPRNWQADMSKLTTLGFTGSISLEKGVRTYAEWCKAELLGI